MKRMTLTARCDGRRRTVPCYQTHTLVVGSGAAGLNAAVQLRRQGIQDLLILTEGLDKGTSINTGSDKQTYYKLAMCGDDADSPFAMAETYFSGGSMHGDLALIEASLSARAFLHLVTLGLPFPTDRYGQFVGYKTDHDPRQRATSIGPYTSQEMCRALIRELERLDIPVQGDRFCVSLLAPEEDGDRRAVGVLALNARGQLEAYAAENTVYATGGPADSTGPASIPPSIPGESVWPSWPARARRTCPNRSTGWPPSPSAGTSPGPTCRRSPAC